MLTRTFRDDLEAASYILEQLRPIRSNYANPEIYYEIRGLEIDLLIRKGDYESALDAVNAQIKATKDTRAPIDLAQRVHLLLQKSKIWGHAGRAVSGFSLALRAVSTAQSHNLVAELVEALVVLSNILNELREFEVANNLIMSALPFALEGSDVMIQAELYERLADAHVGIATQICPAGSKEQAASMAEAASAVEKSYQGLSLCPTPAALCLAGFANLSLASSVRCNSRSLRHAQLSDHEGYTCAMA